eukprot:3182240-Rhodomonas_salina.1
MGYQSFVKPPAAVSLTLSAVCAAFGQSTDWTTAKKVRLPAHPICKFASRYRDRIMRKLKALLERRPNRLPLTVGAVRALVGEPKRLSQHAPFLRQGTISSPHVLFWIPAARAVSSPCFRATTFAACIEGLELGAACPRLSVSDVTEHVPRPP